MQNRPLFNFPYTELIGMPLIKESSRELMLIACAKAQEAYRKILKSRNIKDKLQRLKALKTATEEMSKAARLRGEAVEIQLMEIRAASKSFK